MKSRSATKFGPGRIHSRPKERRSDKPPRAQRVNAVAGILTLNGSSVGIQKHSDFRVHEIVEFPINVGTPVAMEPGRPRSWPGVLWKYVHRYTDELRAWYRATYGRKGYRIRVEKRRDEPTGRHVARIIVLGPKVPVARRQADSLIASRAAA